MENNPAISMNFNFSSEMRAHAHAMVIAHQQLKAIDPSYASHARIAYEEAKNLFEYAAVTANPHFYGNTGKPDKVKQILAAPLLNGLIGEVAQKLGVTDTFEPFKEAGSSQTMN